MPLENPVRKTAESIHKIILFVLYRVPPEKREKFLSRIRGKVQKMNPVEMSGKKVPVNSTIGQAISLTKNILNGLNPAFTQQVLQELMVILSQYKGEKRAMLKNAQVDVIIEPFDSVVQNAVRRIKLKDPKIFESVTKIIVHRGLGGGRLGFVESGQGKDPSAIHLYKTPILEQAKRQGGAISGRELDEVFEHALVEVIGHEAGHIHGGTGPHQPFGDEHAAGRAGEEAVARTFPADDKPISKRQKDKRSISKRQNAIDNITDLGYGDYSGSGIEFFDPAAEEVRPTDTQSYEQNVGNMAGGEAQVEAPQGSYGGSGFGLFSIPVGMNSGTVGSLDRPISKRAYVINPATVLIFLGSFIAQELIVGGGKAAYECLTRVKKTFKTLFEHTNELNNKAASKLKYIKRIDPNLYPKMKEIELQVYKFWFAVYKLQTLIGQERATPQDFDRYLKVLADFQTNKNSLLGAINAVNITAHKILIQKRNIAQLPSSWDYYFEDLYKSVNSVSEELSVLWKDFEIAKSVVKNIQDLNSKKSPMKAKTNEPDEPGIIRTLSQDLQ